MRLVFAGTPEVAVPALEALAASRHEVVAVLTRPDAPAGRGRGPRESPVAKRAAELGIEVLKPASPSEPEFLQRLAELNPDCCPVVAYGAILRREALDIPECGWVNLHFSVLPAWRGAAPVQRSIMAGDEVTGACVFSIVEELDAGPVLGLLTERILDTDTAGDLLERLAGFGAALLKDVIDHIENGDISAVPQAVDSVSYAPKLTVEDARIDWNRPAFAIDRQIRGCTPSPGAWTTLESSSGSGQAARFKLGPIANVDEDTLKPGDIVVEKNAVRVGTATTDILLGEVQPHGKKRMNAADWGRGAKLDDGARFV
ncbi:MAG: methionyl-tRNA formyltransferase [Aeromicrobium sp.]